MNWPEWNQSAAAGLLALVVARVIRSRTADRTSPHPVVPALNEFALIAGLYAIWRIAHELPLTHDAGAIDRARQIVRLQNFLHLPTELSLQHVALRHDWLGWFTSVYYAVIHVPATIGFLIWLFVRHRDRYSHWRNGLAWLTAFCLFIRFVRVAPPRFLPDLGYVDLAAKYGLSVYGPVGTGVSDQFAAMPSIHVGWAAVVSFGVVAASTSRWRWWYLAHLVLTMLVVSASGNHWWLDGIVAVGLLGIGLAIDTGVRHIAASARDRSVELVSQMEPEPVSSGHRL